MVIPTNTNNENDSKQSIELNTQQQSRTASYTHENGTEIKEYEDKANKNFTENNQNEKTTEQNYLKNFENFSRNAFANRQTYEFLVSNFSDWVSTDTKIELNVNCLVQNKPLLCLGILDPIFAKPAARSMLRNEEAENWQVVDLSVPIEFSDTSNVFFGPMRIIHYHIGIGKISCPNILINLCSTPKNFNLIVDDWSRTIAQAKAEGFRIILIISEPFLCNYKESLAKLGIFIEADFHKCLDVLVPRIEDDISPDDVFLAMQESYIDIAKALHDGDGKALKQIVKDAIDPEGVSIEMLADELMEKHFMDQQNPAMWGAAFACAEFHGVGEKFFDLLAQSFARAPDLVRPTFDDNGNAIFYDIRPGSLVRKTLNIVRRGPTGKSRIEFERREKFSKRIAFRFKRDHGTEAHVMIASAIHDKVFLKLKDEGVARLGIKLAEDVLDREDGNQQSTGKTIADLICTAITNQQSFEFSSELIKGSVDLLLKICLHVDRLYGDSTAMSISIVDTIWEKALATHMLVCRVFLEIVAGSFIVNKITTINPDADAISQYIDALKTIHSSARMLTLAQFGLEEQGLPAGPLRMIDEIQLDKLIIAIGKDISKTNNKELSIRIQCLVRLMTVRLSWMTAKKWSPLSGEAVRVLIHISSSVYLNDIYGVAEINDFEGIHEDIWTAMDVMFPSHDIFYGVDRSLYRRHEVDIMSIQGISALSLALGLECIPDTQYNVLLSIVFPSLFQSGANFSEISISLANALPLLLIAWMNFAPEFNECNPDANETTAIDLPDIRSLFMDKENRKIFKTTSDNAKSTLSFISDVLQANRTSLNKLDGIRKLFTIAKSRRNAFSRFRLAIFEQRKSCSGI